MGMQVPAPDDAEFRRFLDSLGMVHVEETGNAAYRMFLG
jgi:threonine dehydratase